MRTSRAADANAAHTEARGIGKLAGNSTASAATLSGVRESPEVTTSGRFEPANSPSHCLNGALVDLADLPGPREGVDETEVDHPVGCRHVASQGVQVMGAAAVRQGPGCYRASTSYRPVAGGARGIQVSNRRGGSPALAVRSFPIRGAADPGLAR